MTVASHRPHLLGVLRQYVLPSIGVSPYRSS